MASIPRSEENVRGNCDVEHEVQGRKGCSNFLASISNNGAELAELDTESGIQAIIDAMPAYVIVVDKDHNILLANKTIKESIGLDEEALIGAYCPKVIHGLDRPFDGCPLEEAIKGDQTVEKELFDANSGGWMRSAIYPTSLRTKDGKRMFLHIVHDITEEKRVKEEHAKLEKQLQLLLDSTDEGIYGVDTEGNCTFVNMAATRLTGYSPEEVLGKGIHEIIHYKKSDGEHYPVEECPLSRALYAGEGVRVDNEVFWNKNGTCFPIEYSSYPIIEDGAIEGAVVAFSDISRRKKMERELRKSEERFRAIVEQSKDGIIMETQDGRVALYNKAAEAIFGYTIEEVNKYGLFTLILPDEKQRKEVTHSIKNALQDKTPCVEVPIKRKGGECAWVSFSETAITIDGAWFNLSIVTDITKRKEAEEMVNYMAYYDVLTGLPNKMLLLDRLSSAIVNVQRNRKALAILYFALDNFRTIIDTLGHDVGDELLKKIVSRFASCLNGEETLAHLGGGDFVLLLPDVRSAEDPARFAETLLKTLRPAFHFGGNDVHISASIGISLCPTDGVDAQELLKNADAALNMAREKGKNNYRFYEMCMNRRAVKRLSMEGKLHKALDKGEFILHYQPQVCITSNEIKGLEALLRWQNPDLGFVSTAEFIPLAEDTGLICPIGEWVLRTACEQNKAWQAKGYSPMRVGVNLSARQFQQKNLVGKIERILKETALDPSYLELEITESVVMREADAAISALCKLKEMGIKVAIDDFGTGYSSLGYLKRFPIDRLKIDKIFIDTIAVEPNDRAIINAIIAMAHTLSLEVVAEGVETEEQLKLLRSLLCNEMQGYLFSEPLPAEDIEKLLLNNNQLCA